MPDSISEQIMQNIATTLAAVQVASGDPWLVDLTVLRHKPALKSRARATGDCHVYRTTVTPVESTPDSLNEFMMTVEIVYIHGDGDETSTNLTEQKLSIAEADIHSAMMADHSRGGLAIDTIYTGGEYQIQADESFHAVVVSFDIQFRFSWTDMRA